VRRQVRSIVLRAVMLAIAAALIAGAI